MHFAKVVSYRFTISDSTEYFVKFEVPEDMVEIYEQNPERHIFQVNSYNVQHSQHLTNNAKVNAESEDAEELFPVDVTIKQFHRMITFQLPTVERKGEK